MGEVNFNRLDGSFEDQLATFLALAKEAEEADGSPDDDDEAD